MTGSSLRRYFSVRRIVASNSLFLILFAALVTFGQVKDTITLYQAIRDGKVVATFKGTGGSSGDAVEVEVAKTPKAGPGPLDLTIPPGSMLHSANGAEQSMVVMGVEGRSTSGGTFAPASHITVSSTKPVTYILSAFCAEFEKENPSTRDTFTLEEPVPMLTCLAREGKTMSIPAQQAAVWQYTDGMTFGRVNEKFTVSQTEWAAASRAVEHCRLSGTKANSAAAAPVPNVAAARHTASGSQMGQNSGATLSAGPIGQIQIAAEEGNSEAQFQLGRLYLEGRLVPRDRSMAYFWFNIAANGWQGAAKERDNLEKILTPLQVAQAEDMSRNWKPKEVLQGPLMRAGFVKQIEVQLSMSRDGFKSELTTGHGKEANGELWDTTARFPGASSKTCTARTAFDKFVTVTNGLHAQRVKDGWRARVFSAQDLARLECTIFESADPSAARAAFDDLTEQVWDLLPGDWLRKVASEKELDSSPTRSFIRGEVRFLFPGATKEISQDEPSVILTLDVNSPPLGGGASVRLSINANQGCVCTADMIGLMDLSGYERKSARSPVKQ